MNIIASALTKRKLNKISNIIPKNKNKRPKISGENCKDEREENYQRMFRFAKNS